MKENRLQGEKATENLIVLGEDLTLPFIGEAKQAIMTALDSGEEVTIEAGSVDRADISTLQLLCAAHKTAVGSGKKLTIRNIGQTVVQLARETGFLRDEPCSGAEHCFWTQGGKA